MARYIIGRLDKSEPGESRGKSGRALHGRLANVRDADAGKSVETLIASWATANALPETERTAACSVVAADMVAFVTAHPALKRPFVADTDTVVPLFLDKSIGEPARWIVVRVETGGTGDGEPLDAADIVAFALAETAPAPAAETETAPTETAPAA